MDSPDSLAAWIKDNVAGGKVDHVVHIAGGGTPFIVASQISLPELNAAIHQKVFTTILAYRALAPLINDLPTSSFTVVSGGAGEVAYVPAFGLLTVANAAQFGITQGLISESASSNLRVNELRIKSVIKLDAEASNPNFPGQARNTSALAKVFAERILYSSTKGAVVSVTAEDLA